MSFLAKITVEWSLFPTERLKTLELLSINTSTTKEGGETSLWQGTKTMREKGTTKEMSQGGRR